MVEVGGQIASGERGGIDGGFPVLDGWMDGAWHGKRGEDHCCKV